jgi:hypothetical protein
LSTQSHPHPDTDPSAHSNTSESGMTTRVEVHLHRGFSNTSSFVICKRCTSPTFLLSNGSPSRKILVRSNVSCRSPVKLKHKSLPICSPKKPTIVFPTVICGFPSSLGLPPPHSHVHNDAPVASYFSSHRCCSTFSTMINVRRSPLPNSRPPSKSVQNKSRFSLSHAS